MADLDADLYGGQYIVLYKTFILNTCLPDLYGNDEADFAEQATEEKTDSPTADGVETTTKYSVKLEEPASNKSGLSAIDTSSQQQQQQSYSTSSSAQTPIAPFIQPTQQIPTYEQPQPSDYRELPARAEGAYQNIPVPERSVRPSEMKDEG